ncbi:ARM repeat-containing protein [Xylariaceae sp. FL1651]|nr:ARM repeat-containing protein [Xylariaceae sp. FL1651]
MGNVLSKFQRHFTSPPIAIHEQQQHLDTVDSRVGLVQQFPDPEDPVATRSAIVDVVALHGLRAQSPKTWIAWKDGKSAASGEVNWLRDPTMLPSVVPKARILTYDWNANYAENASGDRFLGHAEALLNRLQQNRRANERSNRPLVFIASCFGGLLLAKALTRAAHQHQSSEAHRIFKSTAGIVFLGTPFRGSWEEGYYIAKYRYCSRQNEGLGGSEELIQYLRHDGRSDARGGPSPLDDMVREFAEVINSDKYKPKIVFFYETFETKLEPHLKGLPADRLKINPSKSAVVVPQNSACLDGFQRFGLDVRHNLLHKHADPEGDAFKQISKQVKDFVEQAIQESPDTYIRNKHYTDEHLRITRLLGDPLPMEQCYINLAIVWQPGDEPRRSGNRSDDPLSNASPFSLSARLKVQTPDQNSQVKLQTLFDPRKMPDGQTKTPRRVLIRGRAGVGKTTLCKKIVHDFLRGRIWENLFTCVLWLPLRRLKQNKYSKYDIGEVLHHVYFHGLLNASSYSKTLWDTLNEKQYRDTLFILDGVDEVSEFLDSDHSGYNLLQSLFKMPNVIITTRPHITIQHDFQEPDIELETIGFLPEEVQAYLERVVQDSGRVQDIQQLLQKHWLLQSLARIPIQLDALSSLWDHGLPDAEIPKTMTGVYKAIVQRLWQKDVTRLGKLSMSDAKIAHYEEIDACIKPIEKVVEHLAFSGMYNDVIELQRQHRGAILKLVKLPDEWGILDGCLGNVSFLRTSDPSIPLSRRSYHFLHLTFQEFFAAQYLARQWRADKDLEYYDFKTKKWVKISPTKFLQQHKYNARYDIVWRFAIGLLDNNGKDNFLAAIKQEPFDLLGPTHQRLMMHCLTEVDHQTEHRCHAEETLAQWLFHECDLANTSRLATESEFPDRSLELALATGSNQQKSTILKSLSWSSRYLSNTAVETIVELLKNTNQDVRRAAADALGKQSNLSDRAVEAIIELLKDTNQDVRRAAVNALRNQSNLSDTVVKAIIELLKDTNQDVRWAAAEALRNQSNLSDRAVEAIVELLKDTNQNVRRAAADAFRKQSNLSDRAVEAIVELLKDTNPNVRRAAADALRNQSNLSDRAVKAIIELLKDTNQDVRRAAADALRNQSNLSDTAVKAIIELLKDTNQDVRWAAAEALKNQSNLSDRAVKTIIELLKDTNQNVRRAAADTLKNQSNLSDTVVEAIVELLKDTNQNVRWAAADALRNQSNLSDRAVKAIIELLKDTNPNIRRAAADALRNQSNLSDRAVEAIIELLKDTNQNVRRAAADALRNQSNLSDRAVEAIIELLKDTNQDVRRAAVNALRNQSNLSDTVVKAIIELLKDTNQDVRRAAVDALGNQSNLSNTAVKAIIELLKDTNPNVRWAAADALRNQSNLSDRAVEAIVELLKNTNQDVRRAAVNALGNQSNLSDTAVEAIVELLKNTGLSVRRAAAYALKKQSNLSDTAVEAIVELLKDIDPNIRWAAAGALKNQSNLSDTAVKAIVELLKDIDLFVRWAAANALGNQSNLSNIAVEAIIQLLKDTDQNVQWSIARTIGSSPLLIDKIANISGMLQELNNSKPFQSPCNPEVLQFLYGSLLCRAFTEEFCLHSDDDRGVYIRQSTGIRDVAWSANKRDLFLKTIEQSRKLWNPSHYKLW